MKYTVYQITFDLDQQKKRFQFCCSDLTPDVAHIAIARRIFYYYNDTPREQLEDDLDKYGMAIFEKDGQMHEICNVQYKPIKKVGDLLFNRYQEKLTRFLA